MTRQITALTALAVAMAAMPAAAQEGGLGADSSDWLDGWLHLVTRAIEIFGIGIIVIGALVSTALFAVRVLRQTYDDDPYQSYRSSLGRAILLGLEFLVAADIIGTVAIEPTLESLAVLAGIVLIRTFLSFSLEVEIEGHLPWRKKTRESGAAGS